MRRGPRGMLCGPGFFEISWIGQLYSILEAHKDQDDFNIPPRNETWKNLDEWSENFKIFYL